MDKLSKIDEGICNLAGLVKVIHDLIMYSVESGSGDCVHMLRIAEIMLEDAEQLVRDFDFYDTELHRSEYNNL